MWWKRPIREIFNDITYVVLIAIIVLALVVLTQETKANYEEQFPEPITIDTPAGDVIVEEPVIAPVVIEEVEETEAPIIDPEYKELLACVIYQEAGGDAYCDECRRRVADVVLNRVEDSRFPDSIYEVLTAKNQYGRFYWTDVVWPQRAFNENEKDAVERAYRIAEEVLSGQHSDLYGNGYIWQAEFKQGKDIIYHCGHYFGR